MNVSQWARKHRGNSHSGFKVQEDGTRDITRIVGLIEKDILAVTSFSRKVLEITGLVYAVLLAQLLPKLLADAVAALAGL